jgi:hypothetical protein
MSVKATSATWRYTTVAFLCASLLLGAWLRLSGLDAKSITHPEMYVPGIPLPDGISEPAERGTITRILTGTFSSDTHPPGYYLFMFPWTRAVGTSLQAIRLPSALLGFACIPLLFWLGSLAGRRNAGLVAAVLLSVNGYHVFWSKVARMFALGCFLGLVSCVLLLLIAQSSRRRTILLAAYVVVILAGVATHVFFWSLFIAQMLWTFGNAAGRRQLPDLCRTQLLALVLGSPLIAFAAYQSGNTVANLSNNVLEYVSQFLSFAFVLPTSSSGFFLSAVPYTGSQGFSIARGALLLIGLVLFVMGLRQLWQSAPAKPVLVSTAPGSTFWTVSWIVAGVIGTIEIAAFLYLVRTLPPAAVNRNVRVTEVLLILPFMLTALAFLLQRMWIRLPEPGRWRRLIAGESGLVALLAIAPLVALCSLAQFRPILNQRGLLFTSPYLLLLLGVGIATIKRKVWVAALAPVLVVTCVASSRSYGQMMVDPVDYGGFAKAIQSEIGPGDLVFVRKAWYETPILYYLHKDRYRLVGRNFENACARNPEARIWVVLLYDADPAREMQTALTGYRALKTITGPKAKAILYEHRTT